MAIAQWPATLPAPLIGNARQAISGLVDEAEVVNPERNRRLPDFQETFSWVFDSTELAAFKTFVDTTLSDGQAAFEADWLEYAGYANHAARFILPYQLSLGNDIWRVEANLEVINIGGA